MELLGTREQQYVRDRLAGMPRPVKMVLFTDGTDSEWSHYTEVLGTELMDTVPELSLIVRHHTDPAARAFQVDNTPAMALVPGEDDGDLPTNGIRFFGFPGGYEFDSLLEAIRRVSTADPGVSGDLLQYVVGLQEPLHLQVFVTQSCPYCPRMVQLAHRLALASPMVRGDMIDASEFPALSDRFGVQGVPMTIINSKGSVVGAVPEHRLLAELRRNGKDA